MDILATLQNCVNALNGLRPRVDQPEIFQIVQMVINTLNEVKEEMNRREKEALAQKTEDESANSAEDEQPAALDDIPAKTEE